MLYRKSAACLLWLSTGQALSSDPGAKPHPPPKSCQREGVSKSLRWLAIQGGTSLHKGHRGISEKDSEFEAYEC